MHHRQAGAWCRRFGGGSTRDEVVVETEFVIACDRARDGLVAAREPRLETVFDDKVITASGRVVPSLVEPEGPGGAAQPRRRTAGGAGLETVVDHQVCTDS